MLLSLIHDYLGVSVIVEPVWLQRKGIRLKDIGISFILMCNVCWCAFTWTMLIHFQSFHLMCLGQFYWWTLGFRDFKMSERSMFWTFYVFSFLCCFYSAWWWKTDRERYNNMSEHLSLQYNLKQWMDKVKEIFIVDYRKTFSLRSRDATSSTKWEKWTP